MALREQLLSTAEAFLASFNEFTPESVVARRSASCRHHLLPTSLGAPPRGNAEYAAFVRALRAAMPWFAMRLWEGRAPVVDEAGRTVVMHLRSRAETDVGVYENEYVWTLRLGDDGTEIEEIVEFADSQYTAEWIPKLLKAVEDKKNAKP